jgi:hypothetical protein
MIDMSDGADVHMRFFAFELRLSHKGQVGLLWLLGCRLKRFHDDACRERLTRLRMVILKEALFQWSLRPGLNRRPRPYQGRALPTELLRLFSSDSSRRRSPAFQNPCGSLFGQRISGPAVFKLAARRVFTGRSSGARGRKSPIRSGWLRERSGIFGFSISRKRAGKVASRLGVSNNLGRVTETLLFGES